MRVALHLLLVLLTMSATPSWQPLGQERDADVISATPASSTGVISSTADAEDDLDDSMPHELSELAPIHRDEAPVSGCGLCSTLWTERLHRPPIA